MNKQKKIKQLDTQELLKVKGGGTGGGGAQVPDLKRSLSFAPSNQSLFKSFGRG